MSTTVYDRLDPTYRHSVLDAFVQQRARRRSLSFVGLTAVLAAAAMTGVAALYDAMEHVWFLLVPVAVFALGYAFKLRARGDAMGAALAGLGLNEQDRAQLFKELASHPDFAGLREKARLQSIEASKAMHAELKKNARRAA